MPAPAEAIASFNVSLRISEELIAETLCAAWEGGSSYWARAKGQPHHTPAGLRVLALDQAAFPIPVFVVDEGRDDPTVMLTLDSLCTGAQIMAEKYPHHFADAFLDPGRGDATTGDVYLQCCLFGEVLYG